MGKNPIRRLKTKANNLTHWWGRTVKRSMIPGRDIANTESE